MRALHGVISLTPHALPVLKRHLFIFDKFHLADLDQEFSWTLPDDVAASLNADLAFLQEKNLVAWLPHRKATMKLTAAEVEAHMRYIASLSEEIVSDIIAGSEDTAKLNWTKIAKLGVSVKQRKIELLEAELKAPGRECAYVFETRMRFK